MTQTQLLSRLVCPLARLARQQIASVVTLEWIVSVSLSVPLLSTPSPVPRWHVTPPKGTNTSWSDMPGAE